MTSIEAKLMAIYCCRKYLQTGLSLEYKSVCNLFLCKPVDTYNKLPSLYTKKVEHSRIFNKIMTSTRYSNIYIGLISAIERDNIHDIIVITDSIAAVKKILESKVNPLQNIFIPIVSAIEIYLRKDSRNKIHF